jgi:hypothetical protein
VKCSEIKIKQTSGTKSDKEIKAIFQSNKTAALIVIWWKLLMMVFSIFCRREDSDLSVAMAT